MYEFQNKMHQKRNKKICAVFLLFNFNMSTLIPVINWYKKNKRELPWRDTSNPYFIWLSEIILQQTKIEQGLPYYLKFAEKYPTIVDLANASTDEIMKLWQGLGYYSRAENMHRTAIKIKEEYGGKFPNTYNELITLKGIGSYTAAAIASIAFNEPKAVVDGNVFRFLSRLFAVDTPIDTSKGKKIFEEIAQELINPQNPGLHNQAIMEFGSQVCNPKQPLCATCIMQLQCKSLQLNKVNQFPVKQNKTKVKNRYLNYLFIETENKLTYIRQRNDEGIWNKLYEFPVIELDIRTDNPIHIINSPTFNSLFKNKKIMLDLVFQNKHQLTHQTIFANFWKVSGKNIKIASNTDFTMISINEINSFAMPRLLERFLNSILPKV